MSLNFFQDLKQKLEKSMETAGQKSQQMLEMSRLAIRIKGKKEDIERSVSTLGWEVFHNWNRQGGLEMTDEILKLLEAVRDQQNQLALLERELAELKSSLITLRETAEKVDLGTEKEEAPNPDSKPAEPVRAEPVVKAMSSSPRKPGHVPRPSVAAVVYICPFCARQVPAESSGCPHCRRRFF
jgi:hypothetical protein